MKDPFSYKRIPPSRIATFDTFSVGLLRHHISALLDFDVTESQLILQNLKKNGAHLSFNAWLIKAISNALEKHPEATAYLYSKKKLIIFNNINVALVVEKMIGNQLVPIPLVIEQANQKSIQEITKEIEAAKNQDLTNKDIVINRRTTFSEKLYYFLPGFLRQFIWKMMLRNPKFIFKKMGNVSITSVGMIGKVNGWFIHKAVHPVSFGIGSIIQKPVVLNHEIKIREILNMTVLIDHDIIDGAPMVRLLNDLTKEIETGELLKSI